MPAESMCDSAYSRSHAIKSSAMSRDALLVISGESLNISSFWDASFAKPTAYPAP
jgi:hypothetical protein